MADVEFREVIKIYDKKVKAVDKLSFKCEDKEFFAILGPSGCGKSSSLRMLAGLEEITDGDILIGGKRVNDLSPRERNVAMSFENYGLYPDFTIFDNIAYPLKILKMDPSQIEEKVRTISKKLRLTNVLHVKPAALSSGQKQRVSIARALVRNPDVTIMDEPLSHLDARMRSNMRSVIRSLHDQLGLTTVYVTHDQIEAMTMADKILIMNAGELQQVGTPDEVYNYPANEFVAGFVGTPQMNLFDAQIYQKENVFHVKKDNVMDITLESYGEDIGKEKNVAFGIRPHDIDITEEPREGYSSGTVYVTEPLGEVTIISIQAGDLILKVEKDGNLFQYQPNQIVYFKMNQNKIHLFRKNDTDSGERILPLSER